MRDFITNIPKTIRAIYSGKNLLWQLLAIVLTYILVASGFDWLYFTSVRSQLLNTLAIPAMIGVFLIPLILICMVVIGKVYNNKRMSMFGWALGQAAFVGWFISSFYKVFTGRVQPNLANIIVDSSHSFHFGILEHGIFWGWPSSHTAVAFAVAFTCISLLSPKKRRTRYAAFLCALYVGISVSFAIHWFSDFVAGAIIGAVIGIATGKEWRKKLE